METSRSNDDIPPATRQVEEGTEHKTRPPSPPMSTGKKIVVGIAIFIVGYIALAQIAGALGWLEPDKDLDKKIVARELRNACADLKRGDSKLATAADRATLASICAEKGYANR